MSAPATRLLDVLRECGVPFVVIGGYAVSFHGYVRATEDLDIVFRRTAQSEAALVEALVRLDAAWIADEIDPATGLERLVPITADYVRHTHLMMLWTRHGYLDIFDHIPGHPAEDVARLFDTAETLDGTLFVSLSWLRRMKEVSGRPKDIEDLNRLSD